MDLGPVDESTQTELRPWLGIFCIMKQVLLLTCTPMPSETGSISDLVYRRYAPGLN